MYEILIISSAKKDLNRLQKKLLSQIAEKIRTLKENPRPKTCVKLTAQEGYRIRSGTYRILYRIDDKNKKIYIYRIKHRRDAYQ